MTWVQYCVAMTYAQLKQLSGQRVLDEEEEYLLKHLTATVKRYGLDVPEQPVSGRARSAASLPAAGGAHA